MGKNRCATWSLRDMSTGRVRCVQSQQEQADVCRYAIVEAAIAIETYFLTT